MQSESTSSRLCGNPRRDDATLEISGKTADDAIALADSLEGNTLVANLAGLGQIYTRVKVEGMQVDLEEHHLPDALKPFGSIKKVDYQGS